jgi:hypothetical protein
LKNFSEELFYCNVLYTLSISLIYLKYITFIFHGGGEERRKEKRREEEMRRKIGSLEWYFII